MEARRTVMAATGLATGGAFETTFDSCVSSLAWSDRFFPFYFVVAPQSKMEKSGLATRD